MPFVIDASLSASWVLPDETSMGTVLTRLEDDYGVVPSLWWFEIYSFLAMAERRKRINARDATEALMFFSELSIEVDDEPSAETILMLARKHVLSGYDAAYLELAKRTGFPLATLDGALIKAAAKEGVPLIAAK